MSEYVEEMVRSSKENGGDAEDDGSQMSDPPQDLSNVGSQSLSMGYANVHLCYA